MRPADIKRYEWHYTRLIGSIESYNYCAFKQRLDSALAKGFPIDFISDKSDGRSLLQTVLHIMSRDVLEACNYCRMFLENTSKQEVYKTIFYTLLDYGADVNVYNKKGNNTLLDTTFYAWTAWTLENDVFQEIVDKTNDVNAIEDRFKGEVITSFGKLAYNYIFTMPLDIYIDPTINKWRQNSALEKLQILLDAGADPYKDNRWDTMSIGKHKYAPQQMQLKQQIKHLIHTRETTKEQLTQSQETAVCWDYEI